MVAIKLSMIRKGNNSVRALNNANTSWILGRRIPEATVQNLIKFILHLFHEVQSTFGILGDKIFPGKRFYQPLIFKTQTGSEPDKFQTPQKCFKRVICP